LTFPVIPPTFHAIPSSSPPWVAYMDDSEGFFPDQVFSLSDRLLPPPSCRAGGPRRPSPPPLFGPDAQCFDSRFFLRTLFSHSAVFFSVRSLFSFRRSSSCQNPFRPSNKVRNPSRPVIPGISRPFFPSFLLYF